MIYVKNKHVPTCYLDNREISLQNLKVEVVNKNVALSCPPPGSFDTKEMIVRIEYDGCPNLTLVDTPGIFYDNTTNANVVVEIARTYMRKESAIIMCVVKVEDWGNKGILAEVESFDPHLRRTVVVGSQLNVKLVRDSQLTLAGIEQILLPDKNKFPTWVTPLDGHPFFAFRDEEDIKTAMFRFLDDNNFPWSQHENIFGISKVRNFLSKRLKSQFISAIGRIETELEKQKSDKNLEKHGIEEGMRLLDPSLLQRHGRDLCLAFAEGISSMFSGKLRFPEKVFNDFARTLYEELQVPVAKPPHQNPLPPTELPSPPPPSPPAPPPQRPYPAAFATILAQQNIKDKNYSTLGGGQFHRAVDTFKQAITLSTQPVDVSPQMVRAAAAALYEEGNNKVFLMVALYLTSQVSKKCVHHILDCFGEHMKCICKCFAAVVMRCFEEDISSPRILQGGSTKDLIEKSTQKSRDLIVEMYVDYVEDMVNKVIIMCKQDADSVTEYHDVSDRGLMIVQSRLRFIVTHENSFFGCMPWPALNRLDVMTIGDKLFDGSITPEEVSQITKLTQLLVDGLREHLILTSAAKAYTYCLNKCKFGLKAELLHTFDDSPDVLRETQTELENEQLKIRNIEEQIADIASCSEKIKQIKNDLRLS